MFSGSAVVVCPARRDVQPLRPVQVTAPWSSPPKRYIRFRLGEAAARRGFSRRPNSVHGFRVHPLKAPLVGLNGPIPHWAHLECYLRDSYRKCELVLGGRCAYRDDEGRDGGVACCKRAPPPAVRMGIFDAHIENPRRLLRRIRRVPRHFGSMDGDGAFQCTANLAYITGLGKGGRGDV